jgi:hypothetical protein
MQRVFELELGFAPLQDPLAAELEGIELDEPSWRWHREHKRKHKRKRTRGPANAAMARPWTESNFYVMYLDEVRVAQWKERDVQKFKLRFGVCHELFLELVTLAATFKYDTGSARRTPIALRVLCALKVLAKAHTFDSVSEQSGISAEGVRVYFHEFCKELSDRRDAWVAPPAVSLAAARAPPPAVRPPPRLTADRPPPPRARHPSPAAWQRAVQALCGRVCGHWLARMSIEY